MRVWGGEEAMQILLDPFAGLLLDVLLDLLPRKAADDVPHRLRRRATLADHLSENSVVILGACRRRGARSRSSATIFVSLWFGGSGRRSLLFLSFLMIFRRHPEESDLRL